MLPQKLRFISPVSLKSIALLILLNWAPIVKSQLSSTLFFMHTLPQSNLTNPAVQIPCKVFVGIPALSSIYFNYANSYFSYNDILIPQGDSLLFDLKKFNKIPGALQDIEAELHISLLNFGFIYKDYYFNFNLSDKIEAGVVYPGTWFNLGLLGNTPYVGKTLDMSGGGIYGAYYREWAFGVSKNINKTLTLGAKAKLLFGKATITTSKSDMSLFTGLPLYPLTATTNIQINASPLTATLNQNGFIEATNNPATDNLSSFLLNSKNKGVAFDFGFIWRKTNELTISGSLLDLGIIRWINYPSRIKTSGTYTYTGYNSRFNLSTFEDMQASIDSFQAIFNTAYSNKAFYTFLSPKLYLGGTYNFNDNINTGLLTRNILYHNSFKSSVTASINTWYSKYLAGTVSWSYMNKTLLNFGGGLSLRTPHFGLYAVSDNIYGAFKYKSARTINLMFGMNMLFGCSSCGEKKLSISSSSCKIYKDSELKRERFELWKKKMKKNSRKSNRN
jgi:hypothetical protein